MHTKAYWSLISTFITFLHFFSQIEVSPVVDKIEITNKVNNKIVANQMRNPTIGGNAKKIFLDINPYDQYIQNPFI